MLARTLVTKGLANPLLACAPRVLSRRARHRCRRAKPSLQCLWVTRKGPESLFRIRNCHNNILQHWQHSAYCYYYQHAVLKCWWLSVAEITVINVSNPQCILSWFKQYLFLYEPIHLVKGTSRGLLCSGEGVCCWKFVSTLNGWVTVSPVQLVQRKSGAWLLLILP